MPLVLEEDVRVANGFDPASASTLYWKQVPVLVKQHDREDQTEQLTFRILSGVTRQNHSLRVSLGPDHLTAYVQAAAGHAAPWHDNSTTKLSCTYMRRC